MKIIKISKQSKQLIITKIMRTFLQISLGISLFLIFLHKNTIQSFAEEHKIINNNTYYNDIQTNSDDNQNDSEGISETTYEDDFFISKEKIENLYKISEKGKQFIIKYEKCHLKSYPDLGGGYTIGYGHHTKDIKANMTISKNQAEKYFDKDIRETEEYARYLIKRLPYKYSFSQEFFDGLCDLIYNAGIGAVRNSIFYDRLQKCRVVNGAIHKQDYEFTIAAVKNLNAPYKGHKIRRNECYQNMINNI